MVKVELQEGKGGVVAIVKKRINCIHCLYAVSYHS